MESNLQYTFTSPEVTDPENDEIEMNMNSKYKLPFEVVTNGINFEIKLDKEKVSKKDFGLYKFFITITDVINIE